MLGSGIELFDKFIANESFINFLQKKITPSISRVQHLDELDKYKIDKSKCIIGAGSSMVIYGLKDTNTDLDVVIEENYKKQLEKQGIIVISEEEGYRHWIIKDTHIDLGLVEDTSTKPYTWFEELGIIEIDGYQFLNLGGMTQFYTYLVHHFTNIHDEHYRVKFIKRVTDITNTVCEWFGNICYHASSVGDIKTLKPKSSNIYKPLVFTSLFEHFAKLFGINWNDREINLSWEISQEDGITPIFTMTFLKPINKSRLIVPYYLYEVSSKTFMPWNFYDEKDVDHHPFVEMVSKVSVPILKVTKYDNWLDSLYELESQGLLILKGIKFIK